jgi:hypothetical protein
MQGDTGFTIIAIVCTFYGLTIGGLNEKAEGQSFGVIVLIRVAQVILFLAMPVTLFAIDHYFLD